MPSWTLARRLAFGTILALTMGAATFGPVVFGVLASDLIDEFAIRRVHVGALVTSWALTGALVSPWMGRSADSIGARRATTLTLAVSALSLAAIAVAPFFWLLALGALLNGVASGASNPATNKLIASHVPLGRQGVITGIKQSGVQFGTFLGGLFLPLIAVTSGWRWAVATFAALPLLGLIASRRAVPPDPPAEAPPPGASPPDDELPPIIKRLTVYGFLLGAGGTAVFTYLPLYGEEALGVSQAAAGTAVALMGFVGVVARIAWSRAAEEVLGSRRTLAIIALLAVMAGGVLAAAPNLGPWALWVGGIATGVSASAWNSVGMLTIIQTVPARLAGRGSGTVLVGFHAGLAGGAPLFGWSVDRLGTYTPGWLGVMAMFVAGWLVIRERASSRAGNRPLPA
jgi:predicted MFS family arabinose efflux permease